LNYLTYLHRATHCGYWGEKDWIPTFIDIIRTDEFWVDRCSARQYLLGMARADASLADGALPGVFEALKIDPDPNCRFGIAVNLVDPATLKNVGRHKAALIQSLIGALNDKDPGVRLQAAGALGVLGTDAKSAVEELTARLKDPHPDVCRVVAAALKKIQKE
jgi:HEAT repeat protein